MNPRCFVVLVFGLLFSYERTFAQPTSLEAAAGVAGVSVPGDDPFGDYQSGYAFGAGVERRILSFLAVTGHFEYYRIGYRGGEVLGQVVSQKGDPMRVLEFSAGIRLSLALFFIDAQMGFFGRSYGKVVTTYIPYGQTEPVTYTGKRLGDSGAYMNLSIGVRLPVGESWFVGPRAHVVLMPSIFKGTLGSIGMMVGRTIGGVQPSE